MIDNANFWRAITAVLFALLVMSWGYFQFVSMMNDSAFETLSHHRTEIRNLNTQLAQINIKLDDLQNKNRMLESRIDTFNNMRIRDHELAMSQINSRPVRAIR
jgi:predicted  nucleic acid-binding Zn-ribbon protein